MSCVIVGTGVEIFDRGIVEKWFEAVFRLQTKLNLAHNFEVLVTFIEKKNVEIEIAIFISKANLYNITSTVSVLKRY